MFRNIKDILPTTTRPPTGGQHSPSLRLPERLPRANPLSSEEGRGHRQQAGPAVLERVREPEAQAGQDHAAGGQERGVGDAAVESGGLRQRGRGSDPPGKASWRKPTCRLLLSPNLAANLAA